MRRPGWLLVALMSVVSCQMEEVFVEEYDDADVSDVHFRLDVSKETRSSISPDEMHVNDVNIYAFRNGMLVDEVYAVSEEDAVLSLPFGYEYDIYAIANMGRRGSGPYEEDFVESLHYSIADISMLESGMPMRCVNRNLYVGPSTNEVTLQMERATAKIVLSLDKASLLEGLQVKSVRLYQSASILYPFKWMGHGGSRIESANDAIDGDYASEDDLTRINSGNPVVFYTLENCQGILLPDNHEPLDKTPGNLGDIGGLCTYLEVCCSFGSEGMFEGDVDYRIYLGLDSTSSFDLPGNACINVELRLTGTGLRNVSWKVDADVSVREGYAYGEIAEGMHGMHRLYVGEKMLYEVTFADELLEYLGGDLTGCSMLFVQDGQVSDAISIEKAVEYEDVLQFEIKCRVPAEGELYIYSSDGECLGCLEDNVYVQRPVLTCSEYSVWNDDEPVEPLSYVPECEVNGMPAQFYVYLVDDAGYNLCGCRSYGFDRSLFTYDMTGVTVNETALSCMSAEFDALSDDVQGQAMSRVSLFCDNDGSDHAANEQLTQIYVSSFPMSVGLCERNHGLVKNAMVGLGIPQVTLSLVDNGWAKYHDTQLSVVVDNPSNLPLHVSVWQLIATNTSYGAVDKNYVENNLTLDRIQYITGEFYNGVPPLYGSYASFVCERNERGTEPLLKGNLMVYPLNGISTDDLVRAIYYDKRGNRQMMHSLDVSINGGKLRKADVILNDNVSNGSATYDYIYYGDESWNYKGASLSSCCDPISSSGVWSYDYPNVSASRLDRMSARYAAGLPIKLNFGYHTGTEKITLQTNALNTANYDLMLSIHYDGVVNGYVKTYPNGTWSAAKDNFCQVEIDHTVSNIPLKVNSTYVWADDGIVKDCVDGIYDFSYLDSPKITGADSYLHRAHPVDVNLNVGYLVEGDAGYELYPVSTGWGFNKINYYHQQDDADYNCSLMIENEVFNIVVVGQK